MSCCFESHLNGKKTTKFGFNHGRKTLLMPIFAFSPGVHHAEFSANIRQYMTGTHVEVEALVTLMESSLRMEFNMAMLLFPGHSKCLLKRI